ncbi:MAG: CPBP family intramembrane metalloprotease [Verrucomicrobia bacterium]|nr:CPBP family intramembrane metalloprotease [Verrucomicrobiota bacterium]
MKPLASDHARMARLRRPEGWLEHKESMSTADSQRSVWDIGFVVGLCVIYVLSRLLPSLGAVWALAGVGVLVGFVIVERRRGVRRFEEVGIRTDNLRAASALALRVLGPLLAASVIFALLRGVSQPAHFAVALFAYPVWGFVQQVIFQGIVLEAFRRLNWGYWGILATNGLFVAVHYPSRFLMIFTAVGGPVFSWIYLKRPNVLPLAVFHGIFGAMLYYVFRDKDVVAGFVG